MKTLTATALALTISSSVNAAETVPLADLIPDSVGYLILEPNVVMIEREDANYICKITIEDGFFDKHAAGETPKPAQRSVCVDLDELDTE